MIKQRNTEFGSLPGGNPDTAHSEYLRGKLEVRNHSAGRFTARGNDVWAERSGRTYHGTGDNLTGGGVDYASPVAGFGMGKLSAITGGAAKTESKTMPKTFPKTVPKALAPGMMSLAGEIKARGGAVDALQIKQLMQRGAERARGTMGAVGKGSNARAEIVKKIMKSRGVSLPEASKIVKAEGLY
jgi:hypothetical protein